MYWITLWERQDIGIFKEEKLDVTVWVNSLWKRMCTAPKIDYEKNECK